jgi:hypothetical protein
MTRSLAAHFDGKVLVPDEPLQLPVGAPLRVQVRVLKGKPRGRAGKSRTVIGLGRFASGVPDLGSNKKHLEGFGL